MPSLEQTLRDLLAHSREAGTPAAEAARDLVAHYLTDLGFSVERQRFSFHPSCLNGFPLFGAGLGGLALLLFPALTGAWAPTWGAVLLVAGGLPALAMAAVGIGMGWMPLGDSPREDANLIATLGQAPVRRWIVAHLDSKAQRQSMAGRLVAVWVVGAAVATLIALAGARLRGPVPIGAAGVGAALAVVAGMLAGRGRLHGSSAGARDNGTGVAAALAAAEQLAAVSGGGGTGVLITGAEEFGLAGARVFAAAYSDRLGGAVVMNLDTIDQEGELSLVSHDARGAALARAEAPRLAALGLGARARRLPIGILTDSLPFAKRGIPAVTVGRLTWRTLRTIHTPRDTPGGLSLEAAVQVGRAVAAN